MKTFLIVTILLTSGLIILSSCQTTEQPLRYHRRPITGTNVVPRQGKVPYDYDRNNPAGYQNQRKKHGLNPDYQPDYKHSWPTPR